MMYFQCPKDTPGLLTMVKGKKNVTHTEYSVAMRYGDL